MEGISRIGAFAAFFMRVCQNETGLPEKLRIVTDNDKTALSNFILR